MLREIAETAIRDISPRAAVRMSGSAPVIDVVRAMRDGSRGAAIIEDDSGKLIGILTDRDVMARLDHSTNAWHRRPVSEVMTAEPLSVSSEATVADALRVMDEGTFRHLPIVDARGAAVGIVSIRDLLTYVAEKVPQEFLNLPPDPDHETKGQWGG